jgi:hypothetical protein
MRSRIDIEREVTLVLTASVDPKGMPGVSRLDPLTREQDYAGCLRYYVCQHPRVRRIVFIENSGWPLDALKAVASSNPHGKELEFVSLNCNDFPREKGKSYGEMLLLDLGLRQSRLAATAPYIAKLTGRNYLTNVTRLLEQAHPPLALYCDVRDHRIYDMLRIPACGHHCDTRFFVMTLGFFDCFVRPRYAQLDDSKNYLVENLFFELSKMRDPAFPIIRRFTVEPAYSGIAGHLNKDYGSVGERIKRGIRAAARRIMPWLYI